MADSTLMSDQRHQQARRALEDWTGFLVGVHSADKPSWTVPLRDVLESNVQRVARFDTPEPETWLEGYLTGVAARHHGPWPDYPFALTALHDAHDDGWSAVSVTEAQATKAATKNESFFRDRAPNGPDELTAKYLDVAISLNDPESVVAAAENASFAAGFECGWYDAYFDGYALSPHAAAGILVRAQKRGRALPVSLDTALRDLAARDPEQLARVPDAQATMPDPEQVSSLTKALGAGGPDAARAQAGWIVPDEPLNFSERGQGWWDQGEQSGVVRTNGSRPTDVVVEAGPAPEPLAWEARVARNGRGAPSPIVPALKAEAGGTGRGDAAPLLIEPETELMDRPDAWQVSVRGRREGEGWSGFSDTDVTAQPTSTAGALPATGPDHMLVPHDPEPGLYDDPRRFDDRHRSGDDPTVSSTLRPTNPDQVLVAPDYSPAITAREGKGPDSDCTTTLLVEDHDDILNDDRTRTWSISPESGADPAYNLVPTDTAQALTSNPSQQNGNRGTLIETEPFNLWYAADQSGERFTGATPTDTAATILGEGMAKSNDMGTFIVGPERSRPRRMTVRRLTPVEAERLQGMPDGWTAHDHEGRPNAPSVRYRGLGNACTANVLEFVGHRLNWLLTGKNTLPEHFAHSSRSPLGVIEDDDLADEDDLDLDDE